MSAADTEVEVDGVIGVMEDSITQLDSKIQSLEQVIMMMMMFMIMMSFATVENHKTLQIIMTERY